MVDGRHLRHAKGVTTTILGGTTDGTSAPGACVIGLFRLEADGSVRHHH